MLATDAIDSMACPHCAEVGELEPRDLIVRDCGCDGMVDPDQCGCVVRPGYSCGACGLVSRDLDGAAVTREEYSDAVAESEAAARFERAAYGS